MDVLARRTSPRARAPLLRDLLSSRRTHARIRRAPFGRLFRTSDFYTEEELKTSAAYDLLRNLGNAGNAINVRLDGPDGSRIFWEVNDPVGGKDWSSAQLGTIRRLMPHIRHFVHVQQTLSSAGALGTTLTDLLDATGVGVIQLNARGRIVEANDRARDLLRSGDTLYDEGGCLLARPLTTTLNSWGSSVAPCRRSEGRAVEAR